MLGGTNNGGLTRKTILLEVKQTIETSTIDSDLK